MKNEDRPKDLIPEMVVPEAAKSVWHMLSDEAKVKAEWFSEDSVPEVPGKLLVYNSFGFWFNC